MNDDAAARWSGHYRRTRDAWTRRAPALDEVFQRLAAAPVDAAAIAAALAAIAALPGSGLARSLRRLRQVVVLALIERDARGVAPLAEVCEAMTAFAEIAVQAALDDADARLSERHGAPLDADGARFR
jgi:glutamate-ammonia-ligase adenylyltransferase